MEPDVQSAHSRIEVGMDQGLTAEAYRLQIEQICDEMDNQLLWLESHLHGQQLKERIMVLNGWMSHFNELYDRARLKAERQKVITDKIRSLAIREMRSSLESPPVTLNKELAETEEVQVAPGAPMTTLSAERDKYEIYDYAAARFKTKFMCIKHTIMSCQSGLNLDRAEMTTSHTAHQ